MAYPIIETDDDKAYFAAAEAYGRVWDDGIRKRITAERLVFRRAVRELIAAGYKVRVHNGEHFACELTDDLPRVMASIMQTDEEMLRVYRSNGDGVWARFGSVFFVYGNSGAEVINDYSTNLEEVLDPINKLCDKLEA